MVDLSMVGSIEGVQGVQTPLKNHKNIGFLSNTSPDLLIQCVQAIIGPSAKRHQMAFRWWADNDSLLVVFCSSLPSSTKKTKNLPKLDPL